MARLPKPGGDDNQWGDILNNYLKVAHNPDGTVKDTGVVASKANDDEVIHNTGNETIAGTKTFSSSPVVPTPANSTDAANKTYVDTQVTGKADDTAVVHKAGTETITGPKTFSTQPTASSGILIGTSLSLTQEPNGVVDAWQFGDDTSDPAPKDQHLTSGDQTLSGPARRITINPGASAGANQTGAGLTLAGGRSTGAASGGGIAFQSSNPGVSGTAENGYVTRWIIQSNGGGLEPGADNTYNFGSSVARIGTVWALNMKSGSATGTDQAGTNLTLLGGPGTGTGAGGQIVFATAPASSSGTTVNASVSRWVISQSGVFLPSVDNSVDIGSASFRVGSIYLSNTVRIGTGSALPASGAIRLGNGLQAVWRNAANSADVRGIEITSGDEVWIGAGLIKAAPVTSRLGFFGATAVVKPTLAIAASDAASTQTLANSIRTALINYGLAA